MSPRHPTAALTAERPPLIDAAGLAAALNGPSRPVVLDASFDLADPGAGEREHAQAHVPGAVYVHLERDLSGPKATADGRFAGRHPLPEPAAFAAAAGRWGITPATSVVVLDRQGGMMAVRAWWLLRWIGHTQVQVLDGGMAAWQALGLPLASTPPQVTAQAPLPLPANGPGMPTVGAAELRARLGRVRLIDARAPERFRGEVEPLDTQAGHIPGASNRFFKDNLQADGRFKPAEVLRAEFEPLMRQHDPADVVQQCGSGVTACHNLFALVVAGWPATVLYPGSWSEWSSDAVNPIARG